MEIDIDDISELNNRFRALYQTAMDSGYSGYLEFHEELMNGPEQLEPIPKYEEFFWIRVNRYRQEPSLELAHKIAQVSTGLHFCDLTKLKTYIEILNDKARLSEAE